MGTLAKNGLKRCKRKIHSYELRSSDVSFQILKYFTHIVQMSNLYLTL